jgi:hypothetical protein
MPQNTRQRVGVARLAWMAVGLAAGSAGAQPEAPLLPVAGGGPGYGPRTERAIFDNTDGRNIATYVSGVGAGGHYWANDFSVRGTWWEHATGRRAAGFAMPLFKTGTAGQTYFVRFRFYAATPLPEFSFSGHAGPGSAMEHPLAVPFYEQVWRVEFLPPPFPNNFFIFYPPGGITFPDGASDFYFVVRFFFDEACQVPTPHAAAQWGFCQSSQSTAVNCAFPGIDTASLARDQNANYVLDGAVVETVGVSNGDHRSNILNGKPMSPCFQLLYDDSARCCRGDFNGDGAVGDGDVAAFFACLAGECCANCPVNSDFNCDGEPGTDADIEAFVRVVGGGAC